MFTNKQHPMRWLLTLGLTLSLVLGLASVVLAADFRAGDTITVGKDEVIDDDLIITGQNVIIDGTINGDLVVKIQVAGQLINDRRPVDDH